MKEIEAEGASKMDHPVCVLDASTYVGFWVLKGLLSRGFRVHAAMQTNGQLSLPPFLLYFPNFCWGGLCSLAFLYYANLFCVVLCLAWWWWSKCVFGGNPNYFNRSNFDFRLWGLNCFSKIWFCAFNNLIFGSAIILLFKLSISFLYRL